MAALQKEKMKNTMAWLSEELSHALSEYGHLETRHINKSARYLQDRIITERVEFATSFYGPVDRVYSAVEAALQEDMGVIAYWLSRSSPEQSIELEHPMPKGIMGRGFERSQSHDWAEGSKQCDYFRVVLSLSGREDSRFYIRTVYPVF